MQEYKVDKELAKKALRDLHKIPRSLETAKNSERRFLYFSLIRANLILDRYREAIKLVENTERSSDYQACCAEGWQNIGIFYEFKRNYDGAIKCYLKSLHHTGTGRTARSTQKRLCALLVMDVKTQIEEQLAMARERTAKVHR